MPTADNSPLRPGDVVELRSSAEILATLDDDASLEKMPFMPEMLRYAGKRFTVSRRVDKICNTIEPTGGRRMVATVYLDDLRCDGGGHDGCQAGCLLYWKDAWLRRVDDGSGVRDDNPDATAKLEHLAKAGTRTVRETAGQSSEVWRCQATDAVKASTKMNTSHFPQYWRELTNGNFGPLHFSRIMVRAFFMEIARRTGLLKPLPYPGPGNQPKGRGDLNLQAGDLVQVRSPAEIEATLDGDGHSQGLSFDREMLPYCGRTFRVRNRVQRLIDDKTGRMLKVSRDCIILDGVVCSGERTCGNWFCPRQIYPYWRESWLRRVEEPDRT
jgi:hypothetical protein